MGVGVFSQAFVAISLLGLVLGGEAAAQTGARPNPGQTQPGGWEFTRWGMSPSELIEVSRGRVRTIDPEAAEKFTSCSRTEITCRAHIPEYRAGPFVFDVLFGFDESDLLMLVAMETQGSERFQALEKQFTSALGKPVEIQIGTIRIRTWDHPPKGNTISLRSEANLVVINYSPLGSPSL